MLKRFRLGLPAILLVVSAGPVAHAAQKGAVGAGADCRSI
jgi:hypothetical protein